jgi:hypothetical protein
VVAHARQAFGHHRDPLKGPQVGVEPVRLGALQQRAFELAALAGVQLGFAAGSAGGAQGVAAALLPPAVPAVGVLSGGVQAVATSAWEAPRSYMRAARRRRRSMPLKSRRAVVGRRAVVVAIGPPSTTWLLWGLWHAGMSPYLENILKSAVLLPKSNT